MVRVEDLLAHHAPWAESDRCWRLTPLEQFMWLDDRPDYPLVFLVVLRFAGPIDPATMADAWRFAIARHPLLRATIRSEANRLFWHAPAVGWPKLVVTASEGDGGKELRGIDLEREPGLRGSLSETAEGCNLELLFHHACCDGHGARMFLQDLALAYMVLRGASSDDDPFFRSDAALLDDRGNYPSAAGVSLWQRLKRFLRFTVLRATPAASNVSAAASKLSGGRPDTALGYRSQTFSANEIAVMDAIQQKFSATRNDIAVAMLFATLGEWQRTCRVSPRARLRVAVPTDIRSRADERMPAANRYTYVFLDRRVSECGDWQAMLPGLQRDLHERRQAGRGAEFLDGLKVAVRYRRVMQWFLRRRNCFSTAVLTNLSDPSWRLRKRLPVDEEGMMWLDKARCLDIEIRTPPLRPGTRWGFGIFEYAGRMTIAFRYDATAITPAAADAIMNCYVSQWRELLATARGEQFRDPAVAAR
jgi:hypothetical protein